MIKKAPYQASDDLLKAGRNALQGWEDRELYFDVGFFICQFAQVEMVLTYILAYATGFSDFRPFEVLARGMDSRVKLRALRDAAKARNGLGPNLTARLALFERGAIPLRNKLLHSSLSHSEGDEPLTYFLASAATPPWRELGFAPRFKSEPPERVRSLDLYAWGVWLSYFISDLTPVQKLAVDGVELEIANPKTRLPPADHQAKHPKALRAKPDKQTQTKREK